MSALATVEQLSALTGETYTGADLARANAVLEDVSNQARAEGLATWTAEDPVPEGETPAPDVAVSIVRTAAARIVSNPGGFASETIGDYSYNRGFRGDWGRVGSDVFTKGELRLLRQAAGRGGVQTVRVYRGDIDRANDTIWVDGSAGGDPFPLYSYEDFPGGLS